MTEQTNKNTITIEAGELLFQFHAYHNWLSTASRKFKIASVQSNDVLCVDRLGRVCNTGREFMRARDEQQFPIMVYRAVI